ncbi:MAG: phosphopantetheine-binding protein [Desulfobia sp.]
MNGLERELLEMIYKICNLPGRVPEDYDLSAPLIGPESPLGMDSLDAVEIVVAVQKRYNVHIGSEENSRKVLASLSSLAEFIRSPV